MFASVRDRRNGKAAVAVDVAPLIDMVFILLIFFLVTSTFARDSGVEVERPQAVHSQPVPTSSLRISITKNGVVYADGQRLDGEGLRRKIEEFVSQARDPRVIVIPDVATPAGDLVHVLDVARGAGATMPMIATRKVGD